MFCCRILASTFGAGGPDQNTSRIHILRLKGLTPQFFMTCFSGPEPPESVSRAALQEASQTRMMPPPPPLPVFTLVSKITVCDVFSEGLKHQWC